MLLQYREDQLASGSECRSIPGHPYLDPEERMRLHSLRQEFCLSRSCPLQPSAQSNCPCVRLLQQQQLVHQCQWLWQASARFAWETRFESASVAPARLRLAWLQASAAAEAAVRTESSRSPRARRSQSQAQSLAAEPGAVYYLLILKHIERATPNSYYKHLQYIIQ